MDRNQRACCFEQAMSTSTTLLSCFYGHLLKNTRYKGIFLKKTCEPAGVWLKLRKQDKTEQATVSNWPKSGGPQMLQTQQNLTKSMLGLSSRQRQASNTRWAAEIYSGKS